jgi:hypothetical protein
MAMAKINSNGKKTVLSEISVCYDTMPSKASLHLLLCKPLCGKKISITMAMAKINSNGKKAVSSEISLCYVYYAKQSVFTPIAM